MGALRDNQSKPDLSLIPYEFECELARVMMFGEQKYGRFNFLKGHSLSSLVASVKRHCGKLLAGHDIDEESGLTHWAHIAAGALMAIAQMHLGTLRDDRPKKEDYDRYKANADKRASRPSGKTRRKRNSRGRSKGR